MMDDKNLRHQCRNFLSAAQQLRTDDDVSPVKFDILKDLALSFDEKLYECVDLTSIKMRVEEVARYHFDSLFEHLPLETSHLIATTDAVEIARRTPVDTHSLVYGEIEFEPFSEVLQVAMRQLNCHNKFVDLGHGIGKAVVAAVFVTNFKEYHGVEILQGLYDTSETVLAQFNKTVLPHLTKSAPLIKFQCASFLSDEISSNWPLGRGGSDGKVVDDWTDADVVFANSTCFPSPLMRQIETMCRGLKAGSRVITFTTGLGSEYFKVIFKKQLFMSWGPATVYIHERLPSALVVAGLVDRVELLSPRYRKWANRSPFADKNCFSRQSGQADSRSEETSKVQKDNDLNCEGGSGEKEIIKMSTATARSPTCPTLLGKATLSTPLCTSPTAPTASTPTPTSPANASISSADQSNSSIWDPDTPTLKNWAREQLLASQSELHRLKRAQNNGISSDSEVDLSSSSSSSTSSASEFINANSWQRGSTSISTSSSEDDDEALDNIDMDYSQMNIERFAYYNSGQGEILTSSSSGDENDDEMDSHSDEGGDDVSDIDNEVISASVEDYYHVKDDSDDSEEDDDIDELYDDSS